MKTTTEKSATVATRREKENIIFPDIRMFLNI
jgi:hypothetical protein